MKKRVYRAEQISKVNIERLFSLVSGKRVVFGVDVAKEDFFGAIRCGAEVVSTIKWRSPSQVGNLIELLKSLPASQLEVAMEPSGTYGDTLRGLLEKAKIPVYLVSPKRSFDASELYDGVPSSHDAKSAAIICKLHWDGMSRLWPKELPEQRDFASLVETMDIHHEQMMRNLNRLEAKLARYWPEFPTILSLETTTLQSVLEKYGSPSKVANDEVLARKFMKTIGGHLLKDEKIDMVIESAKQTIGVEMTKSESDGIKALAGEVARNRKAFHSYKKKIEKASRAHDVVSRFSDVVGVVTAAILFVKLGDPCEYESVNAYLKCAGLNLKERSSGKHKGRLKITKRGSSTARQYLYLAVLRLIQTDIVFRAWHHQKVKRDGGIKLKSVIALMRKLLTALWHVGKGSCFDSAKLFDVKRLNLEGLIAKAS